MVVMNESFSSTSGLDAVELGRDVIGRKATDEEAA
jgi:hypothetical protein